MAVTKVEIAERLQALGLAPTRLKAIELTTAVIQAIADDVANGKHVELRGLLSLRPAMRTARVCRNPKTHENITVPAMRYVRVRISKQITDRLRAV